MSLIKYILNKPRTGSYLRELCCFGLKPTETDTRLVLEIMKIINEYSEDDLTYYKTHLLDICKQLSQNKPITAIDNPMMFNEYISHDKSHYQSTRLGSVFSDDAGNSWYDIDHIPSLWMKFLRWINNKIPISKSHLLYYIKEFPYTPKYDSFLNS